MSGAKPLTETMMAYCLFGPWEKWSFSQNAAMLIIKSEFKIYRLHSDHFFSGSVCYQCLHNKTYWSLMDV